MSLLKVSVAKKSEGIFIISPEGPVDSETYEILQDKVDSIMDPMPKAVVFDLQGVDYISSMGIKVILTTKEVIERHGGKVLLINLKPQIAKVFDIVKAIPTENIFTDIEEMDRYLFNIQRKTIDKKGPSR